MMKILSIAVHPEDGDWDESKNLNVVYDYIRLLHAEWYPSTYIFLEKYKREFTRAAQKNGAIINKENITK